jgi:hypothetical protein
MYTSSMDLSTAQQVLVIILSAALAVALILSIAIGIMLINLLNQARRVVAKAEHAVASAEAVGEVIKNLAGPASAMRAARFAFKMISRHFNGHNRK